MKKLLTIATLALTMGTVSFAENKDNITEHETIMEHINHNMDETRNGLSQILGGYIYEKNENDQYIGDGEYTRGRLTIVEDRIEQVNNEDQRVTSGEVDASNLILVNRDMVKKSNGDDINNVVVDMSRLETNQSKLAIAGASSALSQSADNANLINSNFKLQSDKNKDLIDDILLNSDSIQSEHDRVSEINGEVVNNEGRISNNEEDIYNNKVRVNQAHSRVTDVQKTLYEEGLLRAKSDTIVQDNAKLYTDRRDKVIRDEFAKADKRIVENQAKTDNIQNQALNGERIARTQNDIKHDREIMENSRQIGKLNSKIDGVESQMSKGVAAAIATAHAIPINLNKGDAGVGVGYGNFNGNSSIAIGLGLRPTENLNVNVSMGATQGGDTEYTVGAGASYKINLF